MAGSLRKRGQDSWQLRVYDGADPTSGRQRWITTTVHGTRRYAKQRLAQLAVEVGQKRPRPASVSELLEQWFDAASPHWR